MQFKRLSLSVMIIGTSASLLSSPVLASGFNFGSQSVSAQGTAHANGAEAADPSTIYYNPAGMSRLDGTQISIGLTDVMPTTSFTNNGSHKWAALGGAATTGDNGGKIAPGSVVVPSLYLTHRATDTITLGVGIFVPFAARLNYGNNWVGRYAVETVDLETLNINPSISFKLDEHQSLAVGISAQKMTASLTKAVANGATDAQAGVNESGWGYGFNVGYLYELNERTRFGLAYRSEIRQTLNGDANWTQNLAGHVNSVAESTVYTPQSASANFYHELNDKVAMMGNATWTGHSAFNNLTINFINTNAAGKPMVIPQNWKNSWMFALGANYKYSDALMLRTGIAYDQSPVPSDAMRNPALPDSDRYWLSLGANYKLDKQNSIDLSYSYIFFKNANTNYSDVCAPYGLGLCPYTGNGETTTGSYKTSMQMLGVQYNHRF